MSSTPIHIIEIRVITHTPRPPTAFVCVLFSNGTSSACDIEFPNAKAAELFAAGVRAGIAWQEQLWKVQHHA